MATKKPRVPVTLEPELLEQVEAYQYQYGITSLSKAIRQLVRIGIGSPEGAESPARVSENRRQEPELPARGWKLPKQEAELSEQKPEPSGQEPELSEQERELLEAVRELEPVQKAALLRVLELAAGSVKTGQTRE